MRRGNFFKTAALRPWVLLVPVLIAFFAAQTSHGVAAGETRALTLYNTHTKVTSTITYKADGEFLPEGMKQINHMMRDWRRDEATEMDPELVDLIWELYQELGSKEPIHLISGYRSRKTNEKLRRRGGGQARNSQHIHGKAADIHFPDVSAKQLRNSALVREIGGVGYYPKSALPFVHVDTGKVRHWPRLPRLELAALFPSGKTEHLPRDRKPITVADARRAMKKYPQIAARMKKPEQPVAVASRRDVIADYLRRLGDGPAAPARTPAAKPPVVMASFGVPSLSLSRLTGSGVITGSLPKPRLDEKNASLQLASADPTAAVPAAPRGFTTATVLNTSDDDPEHPEELSYQPSSIVSLMSDTPVSDDGTLMALVAPDHSKQDYLLTRPERGISLPMRRGTGVFHIASEWQFSGRAVKNLIAREPAAPRPAEKSRREIRTASSPGSSAPRVTPVLSSGGFTGGGTALGFSY